MNQKNDLCFKTIIVDDERLARKELRKMLANYDCIEIIEEAENGEEAVQKINNLKPDLVFLDIQMPGMDGFEVIEQIDFLPFFVFVTAYDEYALKAFDTDAYDYLLKPVDETRLSKLIDALINERKNQLFRNQLDPFSVLSVDNIVFLKDGDHCWFVKLNDIRYFESEGNYIRVYFDHHKPLILKSLNHLLTRLDQRYFFRASRKHIVNLNWVSKIEPWYNGGFLITLKSEEKIEVSRRQAVKLKYQLSL